MSGTGFPGAIELRQRHNIGFRQQEQRRSQQKPGPKLAGSEVDEARDSTDLNGRSKDVRNGGAFEWREQLSVDSFRRSGKKKTHKTCAW